MLRIGFHPLWVWQFWQGMFSGPCGLRVLPACDCAPAGKREGSHKIASTKLMRSAAPRMARANIFVRNGNDRNRTDASKNAIRCPLILSLCALVQKLRKALFGAPTRTLFKFLPHADRKSVV